MNTPEPLPHDEADVKKLFGRPITVKTRLVRVNCHWEDEQLSKPKTVLVIGKRTLANGYIDSDDDYDSFFVPTGYVDALLVVENMRSKPFFIPMPKP